MRFISFLLPTTDEGIYDYNDYDDDGKSFRAGWEKKTGRHSLEVEIAGLI